MACNAVLIIINIASIIWESILSTRRLSRTLGSIAAAKIMKDVTVWIIVW